MTAIYEQIDNMHDVDVSLTYGWKSWKKLLDHFSLFYISMIIFGPTMNNQDASVPALNLFNEPKKWREDKIVVAK